MGWQAPPFSVESFEKTAEDGDLVIQGGSSVGEKRKKVGNFSFRWNNLIFI